MNEKELAYLIEIIQTKLRDQKNIRWYVDGSASLLISGIPITVNDLDITTDDVGINYLKTIFEEFIKKYEIVEKDLPDNKKERLEILLLNIDNYDVEIINYIDRSKEIFDHIEIGHISDLNVFILPLNKMLEFYKKINRTEKIKIIQDFLASINKKDKSF